MSTTAYIVTAWVVTFGAVGGYAAAVIRRGRRLSRDVAPERRRWM
jgi:heme exporter protein CcmD